ncbi:tereporin-Ca1-like [Paramisgurnus dabryanus]|uniref:tereporin-Ca1-like n=1 Tax=Paramisgurnus dabryanus TaxID=90735 RepID=UPI0031F3435E
MATAESVSATLTTSRSCTIQITNKTKEYNLINPQVYTVSGYCCHPPQPTISSTNTEVCSFTKIQNTACGAVGVLTYDLYHAETRVCSDRMAILFSVPYDYILYSNILGVGVFEITRACDKALYSYMYEGKDLRRFARAKAKASGVTYKAPRVELRATMSNVCKAIMKVEIHDRLS